MERKDVTPKMKKNNGIWRKLGLGLVGGIIGGLVTAGIFYAVMGSGNAASNSGGHQNSAGETVVENVKVNVQTLLDYLCGNDNRSLWPVRSALWWSEVPQQPLVIF